MMCLKSIFRHIDTALYQCHVSVVHIEIFRDVSDLDIVSVIGQGRPPRPMMCLRSRSAALRMFSTTIVAMASEAIKSTVIFRMGMRRSSVSIGLRILTVDYTFNLCPHTFKLVFINQRLKMRNLLLLQF